VRSAGFQARTNERSVRAWELNRCELKVWESLRTGMSAERGPSSARSILSGEKGLELFKIFAPRHFGIAPARRKCPLWDVPALRPRYRGPHPLVIKPALPGGLALRHNLRHYLRMFEVAVEKSANLLKISYSGKIEPEEAEQCKKSIVSVLGELKPGFRMLSDLRELVAMELACAPFIEQVMDACDCAGVKMVVRIMPDPRKDIGLNIMSLFHYDRGVRIVTCKTLEEAQSVLGILTPPTAAP
jgi:hypothetical protein